MNVRYVTAVHKLWVVKPTPEGLLSNLRATPSRLATPQHTCPTLLSFTITNPHPTTIPPPSPAHRTPLRYSMITVFTLTIDDKTFDGCSSKAF